MPVTVIRAVANMHPQYSVTIGKRSNTSALPDDDVQIDPVTSRGRLDFPIPWCRSAGDFANQRLTLFIGEPIPGGHGAQRTHVQYSIWQECIDGADRVRFSLDGNYQHDARGLAAGRSGEDYVVDGDADVVLVVDDQPWVILTRIR